MSTSSGDDGNLDAMASYANTGAVGEPDPVARVLLPSGSPTDADGKSQLFELYKLMVQTSESLVARRQGANTFFLTLNGLIVTAIGLFIRQGGDVRSHALVVIVLCLTGLIISWSWRTLLISFGQLNKGKFAVILRLEKTLSAAIFDAEWEALQRGEDKKTYRSFTQSESRIPVLFSVIYVLAAIIALLILLGVFPKV